MAEKQLRNVGGELVAGGATVAGYEIHAGVSTGPALDRPLCLFAGRPDGAVSSDGQVMGTYLHGLFDTPAAADALLADAVAAHLDTARLLDIMGLAPC